MPAQAATQERGHRPRARQQPTVVPGRRQIATQDRGLKAAGRSAGSPPAGTGMPAAATWTSAAGTGSSAVRTGSSAARTARCARTDRCVARTDRCVARTGSCVARTGSCVARTGSCVARTGSCVARTGSSAAGRLASASQPPCRDLIRPKAGTAHRTGTPRRAGSRRPAEVLSRAGMRSPPTGLALRAAAGHRAMTMTKRTSGMTQSLRTLAATVRGVRPTRPGSSHAPIRSGSQASREPTRCSGGLDTARPTDRRLNHPRRPDPGPIPAANRATD
jgi:hypothetical protein